MPIFSRRDLQSHLEYHEHEAIRIIHSSQLSRGSQGPYSLSLKKRDSRCRTIRNYSYSQLFQRFASFCHIFLTLKRIAVRKLSFFLRNPNSANRSHNGSQHCSANKNVAFKITLFFKPIKSTHFIAVRNFFAQQFATLSIRNISGSQVFLQRFATFQIFLRIPILRVAIRNFLSQLNRGIYAYRAFLNLYMICQSFANK